MHAIIETDKGGIVLEIFPADAPMAVENFRLLAEHGYCDGLNIHRIVKGLMLRSGDPGGDGSGAVSSWCGLYAEDLNRASPLYQGGYKRGLIAMVDSYTTTIGYQLYIMHEDRPLLPNTVI